MVPDARGWARMAAEGCPGIPAAPSRRRRSRAPRLEPLESRRLLSTRAGPAIDLPVTTMAGRFQVQVSGPGVVEAQAAPGGAIDLFAYGTSPASTITITEIRPRYHAPARLLAIRSLMIRSGQLGGLSAAPAELVGRMTTVTGSMNNLDLGGIGPRARVQIDGSLGELSASAIALGPTGSVVIGAGFGGLQSGGLPVGSMTIGTMSLVGGRFLIGSDTALPAVIEGNLSISQDGLFSIGRDESGSMTVDGSMVLQSGGQFLVGRDLDNLVVNGNLIVGPSGSGVAVQGAVNSLTVNGYFQGQGGTANPSAIDLGVGLNLSGLTVLSGITGQGGLVGANVRAGGSVAAVDIPYGPYRSTIQANAAMST